MKKVKQKRKFDFTQFVIFMGVISVATVVAVNIVSSNIRDQVIPLFPKKASKRIRTSSRQGTFMLLKNLNFRLSDNIDLSIKNMFAEAVPKKPNKMVNFDDVNSFAIDIFDAEVTLPIRVMEVLFNDYVFNYPGSQLKNLKMKVIDFEVDGGKKEKRLKLTGDMKLVFWIGFEMIAKITLDPKNVLLLIEAESIKALGLPSKGMLGLLGLYLEKLLTVPYGRGVSIKKNTITIDPFAIFPPPQIGGYITKIKLGKNSLFLKFTNTFKLKFPPLPDKKAKNYLFLYKGDVKFGKLFMVDARLQMVDNDPKDPFDFYLKNYSGPLSKGKSKIRRNGSVIAYIPDYK